MSMTKEVAMKCLEILEHDIEWHEIKYQSVQAVEMTAAVLLRTALRDNLYLTAAEEKVKADLAEKEAKKHLGPPIDEYDQPPVTTVPIDDPNKTRFISKSETRRRTRKDKKS